MSAQATAPAPLGLRFINWIVDELLSAAFAIIAVITVNTVLERVFGVNLRGLADWAFLSGGIAAGIFCYYFVLELFTGRTFGKALTGTQVLAEDGDTPTPGKLALRTIGRAIPFEELVIFFNKGHALHDSISNTKVVRSKLLAPGQNRQSRAMTTIAVLLLIPLVGLFGWMAYEQVSGGQRIELSQNIPAGLKLTDYRVVEADDRTFYSLTFEGGGRTVIVNQLIAGFDFDPDESCLYMTPTKQVSIIMDQIDSALSCSVLYSNSSESGGASYDLKAYKVTVSGDPEVSDDQIPDYILADPPHRYVIKATKGELNDAEILAMTMNMKTYTSKQLAEMAGSNK